MDVRKRAVGVCECPSSATTAAPALSPPSSSGIDAIAIGAGVGGGLSGLLLIGLAVWLVRRRTPTSPSPNNDVPMSPTHQSDNYSAIELAPPYVQVPSQTQVPSATPAAPFAQGYQSLPKNRYGDVPVSKNI